MQVQNNKLKHAMLFEKAVYIGLGFTKTPSVVNSCAITFSVADKDTTKEILDKTGPENKELWAMVDMRLALKQFAKDFLNEKAEEA